MKLFICPPARVRRPVRPSSGFTLVEFMLASGVMAFILGGLIAVHIMGLRLEQLLESKAGASDSARRNITQLKDDIYGAKGWQIGNWNGSSFVGIGVGSNQQGNALLIYPLIISSNQIIDLSNYLVYYFDASDMTNNDNGRLWRLTSTNGVSTISVSNLIPPLYFTSEDYQGNTQTVRTYKSVIHAMFNYSQFQFPLTKVGTNNSLFDTYRIDVRAAAHLPDGP